MSQLSNPYSPILKLTVTICIISHLTSACFITNCPVGGKRSLPPSANSHSTGTLRQCMSCGPGNLGQCYGPDICCGETIGCFLRTSETAVCRQEDDIPVPCDVRGQPCGQGGNGRCGSDQVCCNDRYCVVDTSCKESKSQREQALNKAFLAVVKNMVSRQQGQAEPRQQM